ncbi:hypothetical protein BH11MYX3_BH11MYX3_07880 [soil metagenome]
MSELADTVREAVAALAASDRNLTRFGAAHHRYQLAPPLAAASDELPEDLRSFATTIGSGGAGPGHGWFPIERALEHLVEAPPRVTAFTRALPICHLGCGYALLVPLAGAARGEVWLDARAIGLVAPTYGTFTGMYLAWIDALAHGGWPADHIPPGVCSLAAALSGYLSLFEDELGLAAGSLAGEPLRQALGNLGPGAIQIAAEASPALFGSGEPVDPCLTCARLIDALAADGLRRDVVAPGRPARPAR